MGATTIWTKTINEGSLTINESDNVIRLSVICRGGTITVNGSGIFQGVASEPVDLEDGQGMTLTSVTVSVPLSLITITAATSSDYAEVVLTRN
jgi:hypothetical protein